MSPWVTDLLLIAAAIGLVLLNGFFVAAEFALVKVRPSRFDDLVREGASSARSARWLGRRLDPALSACQIGITIASLGLGWLGEPAFARLLSPLLEGLGITSPAAIHTIAFALSFSVITALHLVIGEQLPKIFAIRRPERTVLKLAVPARFFYVLLYPLVVGLDRVTSHLLRRAGVEGGAGHETPHTEDEIRALLTQAHVHGELSRVEHRLLHAVFRFDDLVCRRVMVPRADVAYLDVNQPVEECLALARRSKHTRYPVCDGSLDKLLGVVHLKDLVGVPGEGPPELRTIMRPPYRVPETMPISRLLRHFQATRNLMAFVIDEYGTVLGIVTLENVLEQIVGPVEDEFDLESPEIVPDGRGQFIVMGGADVDAVNARLGLKLEALDVDTFSGLLVAVAGKIPEPGDRIQLAGAEAHVLEVKGSRAVRVRVTLAEPE